MRKSVQKFFNVAYSVASTFVQALVYALIINSVLGTLFLSAAHSVGAFMDARLVFEIPALWQASLLMAILYTVATSAMAIRKFLSTWFQNGHLPGRAA